MYFSFIFQVPKSQETRLFSFMNPLAVDIWLYVLAAYVLVSITMFIVARFSPYEWHNPHPCDVENDLVENQFSLANSFWFTIGTLMQQGSDLNPKVRVFLYLPVIKFVFPKFAAIFLIHLGANFKKIVKIGEKWTAPLPV